MFPPPINRCHSFVETDLTRLTETQRSAYCVCVCARAPVAQIGPYSAANEFSYFLNNGFGGAKARAGELLFFFFFGAFF